MATTYTWSELFDEIHDYHVGEGTSPRENYSRLRNIIDKKDDYLRGGYKGEITSTDLYNMINGVYAADEEARQQLQSVFGDIVAAPAGESTEEGSDDDFWTIKYELDSINVKLDILMKYFAAMRG